MLLARAILHFVFLTLSVFAQNQSQNFDARSLMLEGKREEALEILNLSYLAKTDPQVENQIQNFSTQFLNQDGQIHYFEAIHFISQRKWPEAKEKLEQAILKEPSNVLILLRLGQVELNLKLKEPAEDHLLAALKLNPFSKQGKILLALSKEDKDSPRIFEQNKKMILDSAPLYYQYLKFLKKINKPAEVTVAKKKLEKCLRNITSCYSAAEQDSKKSQYFWLPAASVTAFKAEIEELLKVSFLTKH